MREGARVLLVFFLFLMSASSANAVVSIPIDTYNVSCYPALKEFRVETTIVPLPFPNAQFRISGVLGALKAI